MKDSIIIKNIESLCLIGINPDEKINPQPIIINLKLFTSFNKASLKMYQSLLIEKIKRQI